MAVKARVFGDQQSTHEQRRNVAQGDEVGGRGRNIDGTMRTRSVVGAIDEVAPQSRDRRRHLAWRTELDLLAHDEIRGRRQTSLYTHFYREIGRASCRERV